MTMQISTIRPCVPGCRMRSVPGGTGDALRHHAVVHRRQILEGATAQAWVRLSPSHEDGGRGRRALRPCCTRTVARSSVAGKSEIPTAPGRKITDQGGGHHGRDFQHIPGADPYPERKSAARPVTDKGKGIQAGVIPVPLFPQNLECPGAVLVQRPLRRPEAHRHPPPGAPGSPRCAESHPGTLRDRAAAPDGGNSHGKRSRAPRRQSGEPVTDPLPPRSRAEKRSPEPRIPPVAGESFRCSGAPFAGKHPAAIDITSADMKPVFYINGDSVHQRPIRVFFSTFRLCTVHYYPWQVNEMEELLERA